MAKHSDVRLAKVLPFKRPAKTSKLAIALLFLNLLQLGLLVYFATKH